MDAGQGDSTLIVYPDQSLVLIDCGSKKNNNIVSPEIQTVLAAYLGQTGNFLKALVLTHPDGDHYNLVNKLIVQTGVKIGTLFFGGSVSDYGDIASWISNNGNGSISTVVPFGRSAFNPNPNPALSYTSTNGAPNVEGRILAANVGDPAVKIDANPNSVVVLLTFYDINIFLMGDATAQTEDFILSWDKVNGALTSLLNGRITTLKAGHHGSNTSSSLEWIQKIAPQVVFISSDTRTFNNVSIPRSTVINNILANGSVVQIFPSNPPNGLHSYVQYNDVTDVHEAAPTTQAVCTTLNLLKFTDATHFTAYGTSWYYTVALTPTSREIFITPSCGWANVNTAYSS